MDAAFNDDVVVISGLIFGFSLYFSLLFGNLPWRRVRIRSLPWNRCSPGSHERGRPARPRGHNRIRAAAAVVDCGDPTSDGGVVGTPNYRGIPWDRAPTYIIRDNDRAFGSVFTRRIHAMGIRDRPTSFRSPWQNGHVERLIGSTRRECTDHLIVLNEEHLRRILAKFSTYYNGWLPHVSLAKDAPNRRPIERFGDIVAHAILGGLHHRYARI